MRNILLLFFALKLLISSCSIPYIIVNQEEIKDCPCQKLNTGVNVRIRNVSKTTFTKVVLHVGENNVMFAGLKRKETTSYKNIPSIWTNNSMDILFSKQPGYVKTLLIVATDHIGESQLTHGTVTIDIDITKSSHSPAIIHLNIDSE